MIENQRFRLPQGLERVTAPTLVVVGKREYAAMRQFARDLADAIPSGQAFEVAHTRKLSLAEEHNWNLSTPRQSCLRKPCTHGSTTSRYHQRCNRFTMQGVRNDSLDTNQSELAT